ncbi:MAG: HD domain-containing protein [Desulfobacterales bacterium]|nr:HD domain-containing protein [Desulfobacterales bacterium]
MDDNTLPDNTPVSILYIGTRMPEESLSQDSGIIFNACTDVTAAVASAHRPDIVLMDPFPSGGRSLETAAEWLSAFNKKKFRFPPALFIIVPRNADQASALEFLGAGFDEIVELPVSAREIRLRAGIYLEKNLIEQKMSSGESSLKRAFEYLDRFKLEVKQLKTELMDEKNSLNAALKQVQQMTDERRRLKESLAGLKENLTLNMEGFGQILYSLIRRRVETNQGHGERVARIASFIAKELGYDEKKLDDLRKAAMLHEVGLLFMSGPPCKAKAEKNGTEEKPDINESAGSGPAAYDKTLMLQYPVKGAELLDQCPGFEDSARIIRSLNEWSDGTGYPDGLKRRYIPMPSRILAGADELESLRDRKDIRDTESLLKALEELAGVRLDPVIVGWLEKYVVSHLGGDSFRVRGVRVEQLEPGMELGTALFTATGTKLFTSNTVLTREAIDKIIQYNREYPVDETVYIKV